MSRLHMYGWSKEIGPIVANAFQSGFLTVIKWIKVVNFKLLGCEKMNWSTWQECGTKKNSESPTAISELRAGPLSTELREFMESKVT